MPAVYWHWWLGSKKAIMWCWHAGSGHLARCKWYAHVSEFWLPLLHFHYSLLQQTQNGLTLWHISQVIIGHWMTVEVVETVYGTWTKRASSETLNIHCPNHIGNKYCNIRCLLGLHRISYPAPAPAGIRPFFSNPAPAGYDCRIWGRIYQILKIRTSLLSGLFFW